MMNENLQDQIEQYMEGNLSKKDLASFEQQLKSDKVLAQEVKLYRDLDDLMGESDVIDFRNSVKEIMQEEKLVSGKPEAIVKSIQAPKRSFRNVFALAAGFALIALVGTVLYLSTQNTITPDSLYAANIDFPETIGVQNGVRSIDDANLSISDKLKQLNATWQEVNAAYQKQDYQNALKSLQQIEQIDPTFELEVQGDYYFNKGLLELKMKQYQNAITSFEKVNNGDYIPNAEWKKALALLKTNQQKAKIAFQQIANSKHPEKEKATAILNEWKMEN